MKTNISNKAFLFTGILISFAWFSKSYGQELQPDKEFVYKTLGDEELKLFVFEPTGHQPSSAAPAIVFFFGGGWNGGTPKQFYEQARFLTKHGVVGFCAEYRVKSRHKTTPFECVTDGKSAIRWVRSNSKKLGIAPDQIVAAGGSAGGHVAACTGLIEGNEERKEQKSISSKPNAMILFNPVLDTTQKGFGHQRFKKDEITSLSPCHHVRSGIAPTLLFHGTADKTVPYENATRFTELMKKAKNRCDLKSFDGKRHGFFNGKYMRPKIKDTSAYEKTMHDSVDFLKSLGFIPSQNTGGKSK